jgi:hypothetical protein
VAERVRKEEHVSVSIIFWCIGAVQRGVTLLHLACVHLLALAGAPNSSLIHMQALLRENRVWAMCAVSLNVKWALKLGIAGSMTWGTADMKSSKRGSRDTARRESMLGFSMFLKRSPVVSSVTTYYDSFLPPAYWLGSNRSGVPITPSWWRAPPRKFSSLQTQFLHPTTAGHKTMTPCVPSVLKYLSL